MPGEMPVVREDCPAKYVRHAQHAGRVAVEADVLQRHARPGVVYGGTGYYAGDRRLRDAVAVERGAGQVRRAYVGEPDPLATVGGHVAPDGAIEDPELSFVENPDPSAIRRPCEVIADSAFRGRERAGAGRKDACPSGRLVTRTGRRATDRGTAQVGRPDEEQPATLAVCQVGADSRVVGEQLRPGIDEDTPARDGGLVL